MLQILNMHFPLNINGDDGTTLFIKNSTFSFMVRAPLYWWIDCDWDKYCLNMPLDNFEFSLDGFTDEQQELFIQTHEHLGKLTPRQIMQTLPLSAIIEGRVDMPYRAIVKTCQNYLCGDMKYYPPYSFPNEREWADFCETLLDIKGVRDLAEEEL